MSSDTESSDERPFKVLKSNGKENSDQYDDDDDDMPGGSQPDADVTEDDERDEEIGKIVDESEIDEAMAETPAITPKSALDEKESTAAKALQFMSPNGKQASGNKKKKSVTWHSFLNNKLSSEIILRFKSKVPLTYTFNKQQKNGIAQLDAATHDTIRSLTAALTFMLLRDAHKKMKEESSECTNITIDHIRYAASPEMHDCLEE